MRQTGFVVFKKAVVNGTEQRHQRKNGINYNIGDQKDIAPAVVLHYFASFFHAYILSHS
jgi:hypothetical protein